MADDGELSTQVLDANRQKYKEMMSSLVLRDATEEDYRKANGMRQPYSGMTRPVWQSGKFARVAEEVHTVCLLDKWAKMEARNQKRFIAAVGGLTALKLTRVVTKPKEALPRKYDAELYAALKRGTVRKTFTGGNAVVWPKRFREVGSTTRWRRKCSS